MMEVIKKIYLDLFNLCILSTSYRHLVSFNVKERQNGGRAVPSFRILESNRIFPLYMNRRIAADPSIFGWI